MSEAEPLLGPGARFEGLVCFHGEATVAGHVTGDVRADGTLHLTETARVDGSIEVDEAVVAGAVAGKVSARRRIVLRPTARVDGDLEAPRIQIADGGVLQGRCRTSVPSEADPNTRERP